MNIYKFFKVRHYFHHNGPVQVKPTPYTIPSCNGYVMPSQEQIHAFRINCAENVQLKEDDNFFHNNKRDYDYPLRDFDGECNEKHTRDSEETFSPSATFIADNKKYCKYATV